MKRIKRYGNFIREYIKFRNLSLESEDRFSIMWKDRYPCLKDRTQSTDFDAHYIYHTAWAARILQANKPPVHIDISSSLYFNTLVSAFIPIRFYDFRPANIILNNFASESADICALPFVDQSVQSISCMHVVEHIGLGRYGDSLDPSGDLKAVSELTRVLAPGGSLLFVVPVGRPRIMFNAHRIYSFDQVQSYFKELALVDYALIPDNHEKTGLIYHATKAMTDLQNYGCGCFWFKRPA